MLAVNSKRDPGPAERTGIWFRPGFQFYRILVTGSFAGAAAVCVWFASNGSGGYWIGAGFWAVIAIFWIVLTHPRSPR